MFFKKALVLLIGFLKERNEKCEYLIDWIRKTILQREKRQKMFPQLLGDQFINILSLTGIDEKSYFQSALDYLLIMHIDFESTSLSDSCKKKIVELIYWLPKINQYLLTKLAIFILNKNVWFYCKTQIVEILRMKFVLFCLVSHVSLRNVISTQNFD